MKNDRIPVIVFMVVVLISLYLISFKLGQIGEQLNKITITITPTQAAK
jgi:hypothetical protein